MSGEHEDPDEMDPIEDSVDSGRPSLPGDGDALKALLRKSLTQDEPVVPPPPAGAILRGVQRKIRRRSKGRFFADGWATGTRVNHLLIALVMLVILVAAFVGLGPLSIR